VADINAMAQAIINKRNASLLPAPADTTTSQSGDFSSLLPYRPTYTPYTRQEFNPTVPINERPAGTENWTWTKNLNSRRLWDEEQNQKASDVLQRYQLDLGNWEDMLKLKQLDYQANQDKLTRESQQKQYDLSNLNTQLTAQGLIPASSLDDPSWKLNLNGALWKQAYDAGNYELANMYHQANEALRQQAGWGSGGADGSLTAGRMTQAGMPSWERTYNEQKYADTMAQQQFENELALAKYNASLSRGSGGGSASSSKISKELADGIIADMQNKKLYLINNGGDKNYLSQYMAQSIYEAQVAGAWDRISATDKARVLALINNTTNYDNSSS